MKLKKNFLNENCLRKNNSNNIKQPKSVGKIGWCHLKKKVSCIAHAWTKKDTKLKFARKCVFPHLSFISQKLHFYKIITLNYLFKSNS